MRAARPDGYLYTAEAGKLVGRAASTIRTWRQLGYLDPQGLDERGRPLHTAEAVRDADAAVRERGLRTTGIDPRRLCRAFPAAA